MDLDPSMTVGTDAQENKADNSMKETEKKALEALFDEYRDPKSELNTHNRMTDALREWRADQGRSDEGIPAKLKPDSKDWIHQDISWVFAEIAESMGLVRGNTELDQARAYYRKLVFKLYSEDRVNEFFEHMKKLTDAYETRVAVRNRFEYLLLAKDWKGNQKEELLRALKFLRLPDIPVATVRAYPGYGLSTNEKELLLMTYANIFVRYYGQKWSDWKGKMEKAFKDRIVFIPFAPVSMAEVRLNQEKRKTMVINLIDQLKSSADQRTSLINAYQGLRDSKTWSDVLKRALDKELQKISNIVYLSDLTPKQMETFVKQFAKMANVVWDTDWDSNMDMAKTALSAASTREKKTQGAAPVSSSAVDRETGEGAATQEGGTSGSSGKKGVSRKSSKTAPILTEEEKKTRTDLVRALVDKVKSQADESKQREDIMTAIGALKVGDKGMSTKTTSEIDKKLTTMEAVKRFSPVLWVKYYTNAIGAEFTEEFAKELTKKRTKKAAATGKGGDTRAQRFAQDLLAMLNAFDEAIEQS